MDERATICVVSDTHLSSRAPEADANWSAVVAHVEHTRPDLVLHLGDLSLDGPRGDDLRYARARLDELPVLWRAVPGNHDIGDNPWKGAPDDALVDERRVMRWLDIVGPDHWTLAVNGWTLIAINAQLVGSGEADTAQWTWLLAEIARAQGTRIALVTHKPLAAPEDEVKAAPPYRFLPEPRRTALRDLLADNGIELVLSGHVHQQRVLDLDGARHVWAPTTWAVLPDEAQPTFGVKRCGVVTLELDEASPPTVALVEPAQLRQLTLTRDLADPYQH